MIQDDINMKALLLGNSDESEKRKFLTCSAQMISPAISSSTVLDLWITLYIKITEFSPGRTEENNENLSQDSRYPGQDLNPEPPKYEAWMLTIRPRLSVVHRKNVSESGIIALLALMLFGQEQILLSVKHVVCFVYIQFEVRENGY
jgi:hypothetical protein